MSPAAPASSSAQRNNKNRASSQASASLATSVAAQLQHERILGGLEIVLSNRAETAPQILQAFKKEMAAEHGLAQLYQVLDSVDLSNLPTLEALTFDLQEFCQVDSMTDKTFVHDQLELLANQVPRLFNQPVVPRAVVVRLAELSQILLKALGNITDNEVSTTGQLKLACLIQLNSLFDLAADGGPQTAHLGTTRDFLSVKQTQLAQAIADIHEHGPTVLRNLAPEMRNNREVVMAAVQQNGFALEYASAEMQNDREIVMAAVQQTVYALYYASDKMKNNRDVVMAAVEQDPFALQYASHEMRNNRDVVMAAVQQSSLVLAYASAEMRNNREVVIAAVQKNGLALEYASAELRNNWQEVSASMASDRDPLVDALQAGVQQSAGTLSRSESTGSLATVNNTNYEAAVAIKFHDSSNADSTALLLEAIQAEVEAERKNPGSTGLTTPTIPMRNSNQPSMTLMDVAVHYGRPEALKILMKETTKGKVNLKSANPDMTIHWALNRAKNRVGMYNNEAKRVSNNRTTNS